MSTAAAVPETRGLEGDDAVETLKDVGVVHLVRDSFIRFRRADGFSHSRALAFQLVLTLLPALIAVVGFAKVLDQESFSRVLETTFKDLAPGPAGEVLTQTIESGSGSGGVALFLGLADCGRLGRNRDGSDRARGKPHLRCRARPAERRQVRASDPARPLGRHRDRGRPRSHRRRVGAWEARSPTMPGARPWARSGRSPAGRSEPFWSPLQQRFSSKRLPTARSPRRAGLRSGPAFPSSFGSPSRASWPATSRSRRTSARRTARSRDSSA